MVPHDQHAILLHRKLLAAFPDAEDRARLGRLLDVFIDILAAEDEELSKDVEDPDRLQPGQV